MFEIQDFKVLGCENSAKFGKPIDILQVDNISATLDQLRAKIMKDAEIQSGPRSQPTSPFGSQLQNPPSEAFSPKEHATQAMFATQMAAPLSKASISKLPPIPTERKKCEVAPSSKTNLLNVLKKFAPKKPEMKPDVWQDESAPRGEENKTAQYPPVLSQIPGDGVLRSASRLESMANIRQSQSSQVSHSSSEEKSLSISGDYAPTPTQQRVMSDDSEKENSQESKNQTRISGDSEKENSQGSRCQEKASEPVPAAENEKPAVEMVKITSPAVSLPFEDPFNSGGNPFAGMKRVPRTYVAIPRDQQELLERSDAWYPPSTGSTNPYAMIPIKVREDLIAFAAQPVKTDVEAPHVFLHLGSDEEGSGSDSDGESHDSFRGIEKNNEKRPSLVIGLSGSEDHKSNDSSEDVDSDVADDWTPSPEAHKHHTLATLGIPPPTFETANATDVEQCTTNIETTTQEHLAGRQATETPPPQPYAPRIRVFDFPSSSGLESELEVGELHAEGEEVADDEGRIIQLPETSQEMPSTAALRKGLVQVAQSPFVNTITHVSGVFRSAGLEGVLAGNTKAEGWVSSDVIIPATFKELSQQSKLSKLGIADELDEASHAGQGGVDIKCSTPPNESGGAVAAQAETFSYPFDEQPAFERGDSQGTETNIPSSPPPILAEFSFSRNRSDQPFDSPTHRHNRSSVSTRNSIPRGRSALADDALTVSAISGRHTEAMSSPKLPTPFVQRLSRANSSTASTPATTPKKQRRKSVAAAIMKEESTRKNTREMVRSGRHKFNESVSGTDLKLEKLTHQPSSSPLEPRGIQSESQPIVHPPRPSPPAEEPSTPIRYVLTQQEPSSPIQPKSVEKAQDAKEMVSEETHSQKSNTPRSPPHRQVDTCLGSASRFESTQNKISTLGAKSNE